MTNRLTKQNTLPEKEISQPKPIQAFINKIICGDSLKVLKTIPTESIDCVITSPPYYGLRNYGVDSQIGLEPSFAEYLENLMLVFNEVKRVLKPNGTCFVNLGDSYGGSGSRRFHTDKKEIVSTKTETFRKSLLQIPSRFALAMTKNGWILRNEIIWHKPNCLPTGVKDRFTVDFEKIFFFVKSRKYFFNQQFEPLRNPKRLQIRLFNPKHKLKYESQKWSAIRKESMEKSRPKMLRFGRNKRCVWTIGTANFKGSHYAVFPEKLIETPILAGCPENGIILDLFLGSGTTAIVAKKLKRNFIGIELNPEYVKIAKKRFAKSYKT
jgi:site-specific DNA-methyltransferase (adenine-specific)